MSTQLRPLSPHLQIYRPQISSVLSILHRFSGIILTSLPFFVIIWLAVEKEKAAADHIFYFLCQSLMGYSYLFLLTYAFFYHFLNGIRHLLGDIGYGLDLKTFTRSGWLVVIFSFLLTILRWI